jgi:AraC family transcriptional regulator
MEQVVIGYDPSLIEQLADELIGKPIEIIEQWATRDPLVTQLGTELRAQFQLGQPQRLYAESVTTVLATHLIRHYAT